MYNVYVRERTRSSGSSSYTDLTVFHPRRKIARSIFAAISGVSSCRRVHPRLWHHVKTERKIRDGLTRSARDRREISARGKCIVRFGTINYSVAITRVIRANLLPARIIPRSPTCEIVPVCPLALSGRGMEARNNPARIIFPLIDESGIETTRRAGEYKHRKT